MSRIRLRAARALFRLALKVAPRGSGGMFVHDDGAFMTNIQIKKGLFVSAVQWAAKEFAK